MKLPEIELLDLEDNSYTFAKLIKENKISVVLFYNTNCLGCTGRAIPLAYNLKKEYMSIELIVIHSNFRRTPFTSEEILSVFTDHSSPFPIYREENHELYEYFKCEGTPHWLIFDENRELIHSLFGSQEGAQMRLEYALQELLE